MKIRKFNTGAVKKVSAGRFSVTLEVIGYLREGRYAEIFLTAFFITCLTLLYSCISLIMSEGIYN
jgi:hypothetical protein